MDTIREDPKLGITGQGFQKPCAGWTEAATFPWGRRCRGDGSFLVFGALCMKQCSPGGNTGELQGAGLLHKAPGALLSTPAGPQLRGGPSSLEGAPLLVLFCCFALFHWS